METAENYEKMLNKLNMMYAKLNSMTSGTGKKEFSIDTYIEKDYYKAFPTCPEMDKDFKSRFLKLVKGLDDKSIETVVLGLNRLKKVQTASERYLDLYGPEEIKEAMQIKEYLSEEIIKLEENCYYYDGYMLQNNGFEACVFWDKCGARSIEHPERFGKKDIIDAGAFIGDSALVLSRMTKGKVYAFEPTEVNYRGMLKTIELNESKRIVPCKVALSNAKGTAEIADSMISSTNSLVKNDIVPYIGTEIVDTITLDEFVQEHNVNVGLIKVDVEGAEQMLLAGAVDTIRKFRPTLLISIYHSGDDFFDIKPMIEEMDLGYTFKIRHPAIGTVMTETVLICETDQ